MKRYRNCFFSLAGAGIVILVLLAVLANKYAVLPEDHAVTLPAETTVPRETQSAAEDRVVINQEEVEPVVEPEDNYILVSEDGFVLVFTKGRSEICLYTHIPLSDFPPEEQEKLRHGIWFSTMEQIYSYLESHTS